MNLNKPIYEGLTITEVKIEYSKECQKIIDIYEGLIRDRIEGLAKVFIGNIFTQDNPLKMIQSDEYLKSLQMMLSKIISRSNPTILIKHL